MGRRERDQLKTELEKLHAIARRDRGHESKEFLAQNARVAAAEKKVSLAENLWVRGLVD